MKSKVCLNLSFFAMILINPLSASASQPSPASPKTIDQKAIEKALTVSGAAHRKAKDLGVIELVDSSQRISKGVTGSHCTKKISFLPEKGEYKVQKIYINKECYYDEQLTFKTDKEIIDQYNKKVDIFLKENNDLKIPTLVKILSYGTVEHEGETVYIQYMDAAKGVTLRDLILSVENGNVSSKKDIEKIFTGIGKNFGNIHRMLNDNGKSKLLGFNHLVHSDPNAGNFLYDQDADQLYWIDLSGIKFHEYKETNGFQENSELNTYFFTIEMLQSILKLTSEASLKNTQEEKTDWINKAVNVVYAHQALFQGYKSVVSKYKKSALTIELVFKLNAGKSNSYTQFQKHLKKLKEVYKTITGEDIDLWKGYD